MVVDPLLFQGQSLDLQLRALGLLHGLELMGCRHGTCEGGRLGQVTEGSTCQPKTEERGGAGRGTDSFFWFVCLKRREKGETVGTFIIIKIKNMYNSIFFGSVF